MSIRPYIPCPCTWETAPYKKGPGSSSLSADYRVFLAPKDDRRSWVWWITYHGRGRLTISDRTSQYNALVQEYFQRKVWVPNLPAGLLYPEGV